MANTVCNLTDEDLEQRARVYRQHEASTYAPDGVRKRSGEMASVFEELLWNRRGLRVCSEYFTRSEE